MAARWPAGGWLALRPPPTRFGLSPCAPRLLGAYHAQTAEIVPYYEQKGILAKIDGMQDIEYVTVAIQGVIG